MGQRDDKKIILLLMLAGFLLRLLYVLATPYDVSPHDLGVITASGAGDWGHLGYIGFLLRNGALPDFDPRQAFGFYNPPFFYIIAALWMKLQLLCGAEFFAAVNGIRALTLLYSTAAVCVFIEILEELGVRGRVLVTLAGLVSFFPMFTWLAGALCTDGLALLLMLLAALASLRWYRRPTAKNILLVALAIGLGMMTKLNAVFVAPGTALLFLLTLIRVWREDRRRLPGLAGQIALFAAVCLPLGLWWPLRNYVRFGLPLGYVPYPSSMEQYIGSAGLWGRLGLPSVAQLIYPRMHFDTALDTNIWLTMARTALFDEKNALRLDTVPFKVLGVLLLWLTLAMGAFMTACLAAAVFKKRSPLARDMRGYLLLSWAPLFAGYIAFCLAYPHICSMNYRYAAFLTLPLLAGTGAVLREGTPVYKLFRLAAALFCLASSAAYVRYSLSLLAQ